MKDKKNSLILGIDPGTIVTGYGIIEVTSSHHNAIDYGAIRPPKEANNPEKYLIIFNSIEYLMDKFHPDAISIETQFIGKNVSSTFKIVTARAMAMLAAAKRNIPIFEYAPKKAKIAVVGHGSASKEQVQKMVQLLLKIPQRDIPADASDALALAICHAHTLRKNFR